MCIHDSFAFYPPSRCSYGMPLKESTMNILDMEKEVVASAQLKMDQRRVVDALDTANPSTKTKRMTPETTAMLASSWQISAAAAITAFVGCECVTHSNFLSLLVLAGVFVSAFQDPVDDEGLFGAISRILGRATIQTVESSKPRLKRIARAAIIDDGDEDFFKSEIGRHQIRANNDPRLARYIQQLEQDNDSLSLWKEQRQMVDQYLPYYSMDDLHSKARQNGLDINCTKAQLMMRLLEANIIQLL
jgi:hypothetical protein